MRSNKKFRFFLRFLQAFFHKQRRLVISGMVIGILAFYFLPKIFNITASAKRIGLTGQYTPAELPLKIQNLISRGLTQITVSGSVSPSIASGWEAKNNGQNYLFTLKEGLFWDDGSPLEAEDINYNFSDVATTFRDKKTIEFELKEPFSPFPSIVARPVFKKGLTGLGDYRVASMDKRGNFVSQIVLKPKEPSKLNLNYRFYPTEEALLTAFKLGEIDVIEKISRIENLNEWNKVKIEEKTDQSFFAGIFFNTQDPFLEDKSLRQSLAYAIQKPWPDRALNSFHPQSWAYNQNVKQYEYDLENAQTLFDKSQSERGEDKIKEIELQTIPSLLEEAEAIGRDWQKLGLETKIKAINVLPQDFQALLLIQEIPADPDQYPLWHSTQINNISQYKNPKIDKLLEDGRKTLDQEKRKEIYVDLQRFIVEETPVIFLFHPRFYSVERE